MKRVWWAVGAGLSLLFVTHWYVQSATPGEPSEGAAEVAKSRVVRLEPTAAASEASAALPFAEMNGHPNDESTARTLWGSPRLVELFEFGRRHPEVGGNYWSLQVATLCLKYRSLLQEVPPRAKAQRRFHSSSDDGKKYWLAQKCEGVPSSLRELDALAHEAEIVKDLRSKAISSLLSPPADESYSDSFKILLELGDALTYVANVDKIVLANDSGEVYFDGVWFRGPQAEMAQLAAAAASCQIGFPCGKERFEVQLSCYARSLCAENYVDLIKLICAERNIPFQDVQALSGRIANAFTTKRAKAFLPPTMQ